MVITMGCGDACPIFPGKRYEDWDLDDPAGKGSDDGPRRSATTSTSASGGSSPTSPVEPPRRRAPATVSRAAACRFGR